MLDPVQSLAKRGLKASHIDKDGRAYKQSDVNNFIAKHINAGDYFTQRAWAMTPDLEQAGKLADTAADRFHISITRFLETEKRFVDESKRASGSVRDAADKLAQGMARIEKAADFNRLERYVALLERAATAMTALAELQASGKLEKIASAVK